MLRALTARLILWRSEYAWAKPVLQRLALIAGAALCRRHNRAMKGK